MGREAEAAGPEAAECRGGVPAGGGGFMRRGGG